jgi:hypothetical protein
MQQLAALFGVAQTGHNRALRRQIELLSPIADHALST